MGLCRSTALTKAGAVKGLVFALLVQACGQSMAQEALALTSVVAQGTQTPPDMPSNVPSEAPPSSAQAFVQDRHLGDSLGWLGYQVASRTVIFTTIVEAIGRTKAQEVVQDELQHLQPQYQQQWDNNLAAAYAASFSPEELEALNVGDPPPEVANKFRAKQRDVGMDMKGRSSELLKVYVSTALDNAMKKAKP